MPSQPTVDPNALPEGLSLAAAAAKLAADGPNSLPGGQARPLWKIARDTLREPMFLLLLAAAALYLGLGDLQEGLTLSAFVLVTLGLTLFQEGRTERAIEALRQLSSPQARVRRDGQTVLISSAEVVVGDWLQVQEGDQIAADAQLLRGAGLQVNESLLTGEPVPVRKQPSHESAAPATPEAPGGDDLPWLYAGTLVVQGQGWARVVATGAGSQIGQIGTALGAVKTERSPLQKQTQRLVTQLAWLALAMSLLLVIVTGVVKGDWLQAVLAGIALAMAMLPEEYPLVLALFPALGSRRLAREGVLTRHLTALETLGATTVLCSDKTGTLTENRMSVAALVVGDDSLKLAPTQDQQPGLPEAYHRLLETAVLASAPDPFDPMEQAFHQLAGLTLAGTEHLHADWKLEHSYELTPALRAMSQVWSAPSGGDWLVAAKGAPEAVIDLCHLTPDVAAQTAAAVEKLAAQGLRVLAVAAGRHTGPALPPSEHDFTFELIGLVGLADPLRPQVPAAVRECQQAGIRVVMITGDYPATARAIAQQAGLNEGTLLTGDELAALSDAELQTRMKSVSLCARISPEQKLRIVMALKAGGEVVAMTGDGVNDAPALRAAHVGVAMGQRGTDVAREAASLVLLDDNFASIVRAMRTGRRIFDNLQKSMSYILAVHVPIAGMALLPILLGWPPLLFPMHIALLELIIDPACSLIFEAEPAEPDLMQRPPRDVQAPLFGGATLLAALVEGLGVLGLVLATYALAAQRMPAESARSAAFVTLVIANLALVFCNRSRTLTAWAALRRPNAMLWWVSGVAAALLGLAMAWPPARAMLHFGPLPAMGWGLAAAAGLASLLWFEGVKAWRRR